MPDKCEGNIFPAVLTDLNKLDYHQAIENIRRFAPDNFPIHVAMLEVALENGKNSTIYSAPHSHPDHDEVNILVSRSRLIYHIMLAGKVHEVAAPSTIWIPAGTEHSANVVEGEGFFICIRLDKGPK